MPIMHCQNCGYVIIDPSRPCQSCVSMYAPPPYQPTTQQAVRPLNTPQNYVAATTFSVGSVLSRAFSTLFKHPFVFVGLSFTAKIPALLVLLDPDPIINAGLGFLIGTAARK